MKPVFTRSKAINVLFQLLLVMLFGQLFSVVFGVSAYASTGLVLAADVAAHTLTPAAVALNAISITQLTAALGAYYRANRSLLHTEMLLGSNIQARYEVMDGVKDEEPLPQLEIGDLVKPGNDLQFKPTANALKFGARILKVRDWKVDLLIVPRQLEKSWLGKYSQPGANFKIPFEQFIMNYIIAKINENLRLQSMYRAVYNPANETPMDVFDGWLKLLADEVAAGSVAPVVTGIITAENVVDKLLAVHDGLGEAYKAGFTEMPVNSTIFDWYTRKTQPVTNVNLVATVDTLANRQLLNEVPLIGTNCLLVREAGLGSSQRVHVTPKANRIYGTDSLNDSAVIRLQEFERTIKVMVDAKSGVNFAQVHSRALSLNEQA